MPRFSQEGKSGHCCFWDFMPNRIETLETRVAVLETRLNDSQAAIILQAKEIERRLDELNHSKRLDAERGKEFITKSEYETKHKELTNWQLQMEAWRSREAGFKIGLVIGAGLAGGGIGALIMKLL
jgi:TolA-binding protein